jgi:mRNA (guanine-N7-)-methyltransferase
VFAKDKLPTWLNFLLSIDNARGNTGREARTQSVTYGLKVCNNWIKSVLMKRFVRRRPGVVNYDPEERGTRPNGRVLDMGCGKGGDIEKWNRLKIEEYVGIGGFRGQINFRLSIVI